MLTVSNLGLIVNKKTKTCNITYCTGACRFVKWLKEPWKLAVKLFKLMYNV